MESGLGTCSLRVLEPDGFMNWMEDGWTRKTRRSLQLDEHLNDFLLRLAKDRVHRVTLNLEERGFLSVVAGGYVLTAKATDNQGGTKVSTAVSVGVVGRF